MFERKIFILVFFFNFLLSDIVPQKVFGKVLSVNSQIVSVNKCTGEQCQNSVDRTELFKSAPPGIKVEMYKVKDFGETELLGVLSTDADGFIKGEFIDDSFAPPNIFFVITMETNLAKVALPILEIGDLVFVVNTSPVIYTTEIFSPQDDDFVRASFTKLIKIPHGPENPGKTNGSMNVLKEIYNMDQRLKAVSVGYQGIPPITVVQFNDRSVGGFDSWQPEVELFPNLELLNIRLINKHIYLGVPDIFARETVYHEYAHAVMWYLYGQSIPSETFERGFTNTIREETAPKYAFREGWAAFMQSFVPRFRRFFVAEEVTDLEENNFWKGREEDGLNNSGEIISGAIASILWDIFDKSSQTDIPDKDYDDDGIDDDFVLHWVSLISSSPQNFKEFFNAYMDEKFGDDKQAFRKICEKNGIVYSRGQFLTMTQEGQTFNMYGDPRFFDATQSIELTHPPDFRIVAVPKDGENSLHVETELEKIKNVKLEYRKRTKGEVNDPSLLSRMNFWDDASWQLATMVVVLNADVNSQTFDVHWDMKGFNPGVYDVRVKVTDENDTEDTFYPIQDRLPESSDDPQLSGETQRWLRKLGTMRTFLIKTPLVAKTMPLDGEVGVAETLGVVKVNFTKPMNQGTITPNPSVIVSEKCTGRKIPKENVTIHYTEDAQNQVFLVDLEIHDPEAIGEGKHLKPNTLYEVRLTTEIKDRIGISLDGNANGELDGPGCDKDDYCFTFYTGNIVPYLQAVELKQDEVKVCDKEPAPKQSKIRYKAHWELVCGADGNIKNELKMDVENETVGRGLLQVKLSFPKAMNPGSLQAYLDFHGDGFDNPADTSLIAPQLGAGATRISSDSGTWSQNGHVWNATFNVPTEDANFEDKFRDTKTRLVVYAEDTEGNKLDSKPETLNVVGEQPPPEEEAYTVVTNAATVPYTTTVLKPVDKKHVFETRVLPQIARLELQKDGAPVYYTEDELCKLKSGGLKPEVDEDSPVRLQFSEKLFKKKGSSIHEALTNQFKLEEWGTLITKTKAHTMTEEEIKETCDIDEAHPERGGNVAPGAGKCTGWLDLKIQAQFGIPPGELKWVAGNMPVNGKEITQVALDYSAYRSLDATPRLFRYNREYRVTVKTPSKNPDGTVNDDGLKDLNGLPFDGDKDEEMDGVSPSLATVTPSEDTFTFIFKTPKPKGEHTARPPANIPPPATGFNRFLSFLASGGDFCKMKLPEHKLFVKNLNRREEYMESVVVDFKVDSPVDPKTKEALCEWSSAVCKSTRNALENGLIPVPSDPEKELEWGKLNIFPWDSCGSMTHTLAPSVTESRIQGREEGGCLSADDFGNCLAFGTTLPMEVEAGTLDEYPVGAFPETPAPAGAENPDESESVATNMSTATWDVTQPEMLVAAAGFYKDTAGLLERFSVKKFPMDIEGIAPKLLEIGQKVVVLPSASLSGYDTSALIKTQFADFVREGGILVAFTQQRGFDYTVLPGGEVSAAGYLEDISCYTAGSQIDQYHPILAGQKDAVFDGGIDGYFLTWPSNSKILLRRKKNNFPALIVYPYGQGFVVASTLYTDFAGSSGQLTSDETQMLKDLIVWLKNPTGEFTETKSGQTLTLTLQLTNTTLQDANGAKITVQDNMNQVVSESTVFIGVPAGQTVQYDFSFTAPSSLGNYTAHYSLLFDAQELQPQTFAGNFSVTEHIQSTTPDPQLQFSVTAPGNLFPLDSPITFTIHVRNNGDTARTLSLSYWSHPSNGAIETVTVPAHGDATLSYTTSRVYFYTPRIVDAHRWDFYLNVKNEQGNDLTLRHDPAYYVQGLAYMPSVTSILTLDKKSYTPSGAGVAAVKLTNTTAGPFNADIAFSILSPNNQKIYETTKTGIAFSANETKTENITFTLPVSLIPGPYTVQASITREGAEIGKATGYFTVEKAKIAIEAVKPYSLKAVEPNTFLFKLTNTGQIDINSGSFALTAKDTEGVSFFTESQAFTLNVGEQKTLNFSIPFSALQFGTYKLSYAAITESGIIIGSTNISTQPLFTLSTDKPSYKAGDTANLTLKVTNPDIFEMSFPVTLSAPSVSFNQTQNVTLSPKEQKTLTFSMPVTNTANAGTNALSLTASIAKPYTQNFSFFVQPAKFTAALDKYEYTLNEQGNVTVTNAGGLDANVTYTLSLTDKDGVVVENTSGTLSLPVAISAQIPVAFTKPEILSGLYRISILMKDTRSSLKFPFEQYVTFSGVSATVSVTPTKQVYTQGENPVMKTKVTPTGNLQNAKLTVKILNPNPTFSVYSQVGASASVLVDPPYIWFGTMYHGAKRLDPKTSTFTDVLPNTYIYALASDAAYVYLGTESALYRYDKTTSALASFPVTNIRALSRDGSFLWIGTDNGVKKWDTLNEIVTESYTTQNGLPENPIWTLLADGNRVYIATFNKGLFVLDKLTKTLAPVSGLPDLRIRGMAIDNDALWMATWNGVVKLNRKTQEVMQTFNVLQGLADKFTYSIAVDGNWIWVGTLSGLSRYDKGDGTWKTFTKQDGLASDYVRSLAVDAENVYLGCFMK